MNQRTIQLTVNGRTVSGNVEPRTHLADFLREDLLLTGTHLGCEQGVCGACTVMIDGRPSRSCITLAVACDNAEVRTIESFDDDPLMAKLRDAFTRHHGLQCGFCTPGLLATAYDVVRRLPGADAARIRKELSGNLCRCTGYQGAVNAIADVVASAPPAAQVLPGPRARSSVAAVATQSPARTPATAARSDAQAAPADLSDGVQLHRRVLIKAAPEDVWRVLSDIPAVAGCVPGAEVDEPVSGTEVRGQMSVTIGPMRARFGGLADVQMDGAAKSGRIVGRGNDRSSRSNLDGALQFKLTPETATSSLLDLDIVYRLRGPLAQFGRPAIVEEIADRLLHTTARNIEAKATGQAPVASEKPLGLVALIWAGIVGLFKGMTSRK